MNFLLSRQILSTRPINDCKRINERKFNIPKITSYSSSTPVSDNKTTLRAVERQPISASPKIPNLSGNGNTVGIIPFCLGGGISIWTGTMDFGCDQILAAKNIIADGTLIHTSTDVGPEFLWAIKEAGQMFGVTVELALKTYPLSIFGSPSGAH
ncbi:hypothetical protein BHYA_0016g00220 [Botrytis hyacinthi]|uniref:FAD linked oxidase N-terminal domain-containing protein n=1 Tax=Botrytis hyacinthi TaxID=278943 RepID=A0A4Z1GXQ4_9HELO|nr:hypothetical protein BHYA_0016g00220 [Botrytis hyacinthi]